MNEETAARDRVRALSGHPVPDELWTRLLALTDLVLEANATHNLTAVRDRDEFLIKHLADSLRPLAAIDPRGKSLVDVGSGAGFPGLVIALATGARVALVESIGKKAQFLAHAAKTLAIPNVAVHAGRAEELGRKALRERFDFAICRAFGPAGYCLENLLPLVRTGGAAVLMEGAVSRLTPALHAAAKELGGGAMAEHPYDLGEYGKRSLLVAAKVSATPARFPRANAAMRRKPLDPAEAAPRPERGVTPPGGDPAAHEGA